MLVLLVLNNGSFIPYLHMFVAVKKVAAMTSLSSTDHSHRMLSHLLERSEKLTQRHLHKHTEAGLDMDDWYETVNELKELTRRSNSNPAESDDSDSDSS